MLFRSPDPEPYDDRFYWGVGNPKDLEQLKKQWIGQVKDTAGKMLAQTDWMVIRKVERDVPIDPDTVTYRAGVITEVNRLENAIASCADVPALIEVIMTQNWPRSE